MVDIKCRFTCGDSDLGQIIKKCQNIMMRIVWKPSYTLYISNDDSIFWKKYQFWLKNFSSLKKQLIGKTESFLESNFDLNQGYKIVLTQKKLNLELLTQLTCFIFTSWLEKFLELTKNIQNFKWEGGWVKLRPDICFLRQR